MFIKIEIYVHMVKKILNTLVKKSKDTFRTIIIVLGAIYIGRAVTRALEMCFLRSASWNETYFNEEVN